MALGSSSATPTSPKRFKKKKKKSLGFGPWPPLNRLGLGWPKPQTGVVLATPILLFGWGVAETIPKGHGDGSASPRPVMDGSTTPLFSFSNYYYYYYYYYFKVFIFIFLKLLFLFFLIIQRDTCQFFKACDVAFHQFLDGS
jgi:hypothetical protein